MSRPDLNQLVTLDALLCEGSVARAARRLRLSPSAMSRALARLRVTTGDPLLVRAGRGLVLTPRALALRERVRELVLGAEAVLRAAESLRLDRLTRTFTIGCREGFVETFGPRLLARLAAEAPRVRLRFVPRQNRDGAGLRLGALDLETGVVTAGTAPELRAHALFRDRWIAVVHPGHPLTRRELTAARYAAARHVLVSRRGHERTEIDDGLTALGLTRDVAAIVSGFSEALALARASELVATVPERHTEALRDGLVALPLPVATREITVSLLWHPRMDADPAHRWLRELVLATCAAVLRAPQPPRPAAAPSALKRGRGRRG